MPVLYGSQTPRLSLIPKTPCNYADDAIELAAAYGLQLDPWQQLALRATLGETKGGKWTAGQVALAVPRQNGKGGYLEARELFGLVILGEVILHTAHLVATAEEHFTRMCAYFEQHDDLRRMVRRISKVNGQKSIELVNGGRLLFGARSKGAGRGFSVDLLVLDETQELSEDALAALLPTLSARPNAQTIYTGTPPAPNMNGEVFTRVRTAALEGKAKRLAYMEWSADPELDPTTPEAWAQANPALGHRIGLDHIGDELAAMSEETFCRERLGIFDDLSASSVIPLDAWEALLSETDPTGRVAFAIDVSPDRSRASIGVAGWLPGTETVMVQAIDNRTGTGWIAHRLKELTERWRHVAVVVDTAGPAASLLPDLKRAGVRRVELFSARDVAQGCGAFYDAVMEQRLAHPGQPALTSALLGAKKRPLGDAWAWNRKASDTDITPLVAVTFAHLALIRKRRSSTSTSSGPQRGYGVL